MAAIGRAVLDFLTLRWIIFIFAIYLCDQLSSGEKLSHWYTGDGETDSYDTRYNLQTASMTWWEAAHSGCDQYGGNLLTLKSKYLPGEVSSILYPGTYWIGAVEFSSWRWTDGSSLYQYEGYTQLTRGTSGTSIPGNSALACHQHCGSQRDWFGLFGLRGSKCYCSFFGDDDYNKNHSTESRCPGNYFDRCGDDEGMSVYSIVHITQMPGDYYNCGYVKARMSVSSSELDLHLSTDCTSSKCFACNTTDLPWLPCSRNSNMCVISSLLLTWDEGSSACNLVRVTPDTEGPLLDLIIRDGNKCYIEGYWVGLKKYSDKKWIDGRNVNVVNDVVNATKYPRCLAINTDPFGRATPYWISCSSRYMSVCEAMNYITTSTQSPPSTTVKSMTTPTTTKMKATAVTELVTQVTTTTSQSNLPLVTRTVQAATRISTSGVTAQYIDAVQGGQQDPSKTSVYIGSAIGVLALVALLLMAILTYRHKWLCFKTSNGHGNQNAKLSSEQITVLHGYQMTANTRTHPIPVATVKPIYQNLSFEDTEPEKGTGYYNVPAKSDCQNMIDGKRTYFDPESHYEVPVSIEQEHTSTSSGDDSGCGADDRTVGSRDRPDGGSRPYSLAGQPVQLGGVYSLAAATKHTIQTIDGIKGTGPIDGTYNTTEQNTAKPSQSKQTSSYDHAKGTSQDDLYEPIEHIRLNDIAYNHVGEVNAGFAGESGVDGNYDTTRHRHLGSGQSTTLSSDYSHTSDFRTGDFEEDQDTEDSIYHVLDDSFIEECRDWSGRGQNSEQPHDGLPHNTNYYNVTIKPETGSNNAQSGSGGRDSVHSTGKYTSQA